MAMKMLLTRELGRLAKWLRILGFDVEYCRGKNHSSLIVEALAQERVILTRNQRFPKVTAVKIILLKSERLKEQLKEFLGLPDVSLDEKNMFSRCIICNQLLVGIEKENIKDSVPEYVFQTQEDFVRCPSCGRIYWEGTHWGNVKKVLEEIK